MGLIDVSKLIQILGLIMPKVQEKLIDKGAELVFDKTSNLLVSDDSEDINKFKPAKIRTKLKKDINYYVKTCHYNLAKEKLSSKKAIVLKGFSGLGKSECSIMLIKYLLESDNYDYKFVSDPKVEQLDYLIDSLYSNPDSKEIVVIDDMFGAIDLNDSIELLSRYETLMKSFHDFKDKVFIFTTRKSMLEQVKAKSKKLDVLICAYTEEVDFDKSISSEDKRGIIYENLLEHDLVKSFSEVQEVVSEPEIKKIISHDSFNPLLISIGTSSYNGEKKYSDIILELLNTPELLWEKEFDVLNDYIQIYMYLLYAISDEYITPNVFEECYEKYSEFNCSNSTYTDIYNIVSNYINYDARRVTFEHPSLNEYLSSKITSKIKDDIYKNSVYIEQIEKIDCEGKLIKKLMEINTDTSKPYLYDKRVLPLTMYVNGELKHDIWNSISIKYLQYLYEFNIQNNIQQDSVIGACKELLNEYNWGLIAHGHLLVDIMSMNYDFSSLMSEVNIEILLSYTNYNNIWYLISQLYENDSHGYNYNNMSSLVKNRLSSILTDIYEDDFLDWARDNVFTYMLELLEDYDDNMIDLDDFSSEVLELMLPEYEHLFEDSKCKIENALLTNRVYNFDVNSIDYSDYDNIRDYIESILDEVLNMLNQ